MYNLKPERLSIEVTPTVRVAVGDIYYPFLTVILLEDTAIVCLHEKGRLPVNSQIADFVNNSSLHYKDFDLFSFREVSLSCGNLLKEAILSHEALINRGVVNPFSYLIGYCYAKGVDLQDLDIFY